MSIRPGFIVSFIITIIILTTAFYFQYSLHLAPCPLCILERIVVITLATVFFIGILHNPSNSLVRRLYGQIIATTSLAGSAVAARHAWLQSLPADQLPECSEGLDHWIKTLPPNEVIEKIFQGTGDCTEIAWQFAGLSIPIWSLVVFTGFLLYGLKVLIKGH